MRGIKGILEIIFLGVIVLAGVSSYAEESNSFLKQYDRSYSYFMQNVSRPLNDDKLRLGAVIASPSQKDPDYFYHWTRDAGLSMFEIAREYRMTQSLDRKSKLENLLKNWVDFEIRAQESSSRAFGKLGEPKFTVRGDVYSGNWARPQNDGPAIRALAMIHYATSLLSEGKIDAVNRLYRSEMPAQAPIKRDLEFVAEHWREKDYDLWEEVRGEHFFSRMAQRAALIRGGVLAQQLNDQNAANFYSQQAKLIEKSIERHIDSGRMIIIPTLGIIGDNKGKSSDLDTAVVLASLYFSLEDGFFDPSHSYVLSSAKKLEDSFNALYPINWNYKIMGTAIGRYPEDVYDGIGFGKGNPWFLTTAAFAELHCRLSSYDLGKRFLLRNVQHADQDGHLSEQMNRVTGFEQGARDLTWSYVAYLRAFRACDQSKLLDFSNNNS